MSVAISLDCIKINGGTQARETLNEATVADYEALIRDGVDFPPVVLFYDGSTYWLGDGFHRFFAYKGAGAVEVPADIRDGTRRDAIRFGLGANRNHGLPLTNADKRKAVMTFLSDEEWSRSSDREIARIIGVNNRFVSNLRRSSLYGTQMERSVTRGGVTYQQNTENIGSSKRVGAAVSNTKLAGASFAPAVAEPSSQSVDAGDLTPAHTGTDSSMDHPNASAARVEEASARREQQAENDRHRDEALANLPPAIQEAEARKQAAIDARGGAKTDNRTEQLEAENDELREANAALTADIAAVKAESEQWAAMRVQYEQGGFEKVAEGLREQIRVLGIQVERESAEKARNLKSFRWAMAELKKLGWSSDVVIDIETGEISQGARA